MEIFKNIIFYTGGCVWIAGAICLIAVFFKYEDFTLDGYFPWPAIKAPVAV